MNKLKLNCDLGESFGRWTKGNDAQIMPYIDSANIACGFHGGDPTIMMKTLNLASIHHVSVAAHPSYPDLQGFGRRSIAMNHEDLYACILYQISALDGLARTKNLTLDYVKPHGALYNDMMKSKEVRKTIFAAISDYSNSLPLMIQATSDFVELQEEANSSGLSLLREVFADRLYLDNGLLAPRVHKYGLHSFEKSVEQVRLLLDNQSVLTESGRSLHVEGDSICIHGDTPYAESLAKQARELINRK